MNNEIKILKGNKSHKPLVVRIIGTSPFHYNDENVFRAVALNLGSTHDADKEAFIDYDPVLLEKMIDEWEYERSIYWSNYYKNKLGR